MRNRRLLLVLLALLLAIALFNVARLLVTESQASQADNSDLPVQTEEVSLNILLNGNQNAIVKLVRHHAYIPLEWLEQQLTVNLDYNPTDQTISLTNFDAAGSTLILTIGSAEARLLSQGQETTLLASGTPFVQEEEVYLPLRFVAEQVGCTVNYQSGQVEIILPADFVLDGQQVAALEISLPDQPETKPVKITQKDVVQKCVKLIAGTRGEQLSEPPQGVAPLEYQGFLYSFLDVDGGSVAVWRFYVPEGEADLEHLGQWSAMYLCDSLNDRWYTGDREEYYNAFYGAGNLEPYLNGFWTPPG